MRNIPENTRGRGFGGIVDIHGIIVRHCCGLSGQMLVLDDVISQPLGERGLRRGGPITTKYYLWETRLLAICVLSIHLYNIKLGICSHSLECQCWHWGMPVGLHSAWSGIWCIILDRTRRTIDYGLLWPNNRLITCLQSLKGFIFVDRQRDHFLTLPFITFPASAILGRAPECSIAYCSAITIITWVHYCIMLHNVCHYFCSIVQHYVKLTDSR